MFTYVPATIVYAHPSDPESSREYPSIIRTDETGHETIRPWAARPDSAAERDAALANDPETNLTYGFEELSSYQGSHMPNWSIVRTAAPVELTPDQEVEAIVAIGRTDTGTAREKLRQLITDRNAARAMVATQVETIRTQRDTITALEQPITDGADERMRDFWFKAAEVADSEGFCPEYDRMAEALNGISRREMSSTWSVDIPVTYTVRSYVTVNVEARTEEDALDAAYNSRWNADIREAWENVDSYDDYTLESDTSDYSAEVID